jgi:hypothetical protein
MKYKEISIKHASKNWLKVCRLAYSGDVKKGARHKPTPILITRFAKPYVLMQRFTDEVEKFDQLKTGKITWEDFKGSMLQKGYETMMSGEVRVKPADIVGAERVEVERQKANTETAAFMLDAAKYFSGNLYVCNHCGHTMLPASPEQEVKYLDGTTIPDTEKTDKP